MRKFLLATVVVLGVFGATGCEPKMTITAQVSEAHPQCGGDVLVTGTITPGGATDRIALQKSSASKWVDWKPAGGVEWYISHNHYELTFVAPAHEAVHKLRVRSGGGGSASPAFYITPTPFEGDTC